MVILTVMVIQLSCRLNSHAGLRAIVEQTHEVLLGLQPATCSPSSATIAAAAATISDNIKRMAARIASSAEEPAGQSDVPAEGTHDIKQGQMTKHSQDNSASEPVDQPQQHPSSALGAAAESSSQGVPCSCSSSNQHRTVVDI